MRKKEITQIYQILNKTFRDIALTFAGIALENNFKDEVITDFLTACRKNKYISIQRLCRFYKRYKLVYFLGKRIRKLIISIFIYF